MNPMAGRISTLLAFLIATTLFGVGCAGTPKVKPKAWTVSIVKTTGGSVQVDVIGIRKEEIPRWENYSLDDYWEENDRRRAELKDDAWKIRFEQGKTATLDPKDPLWKRWLSRGATHLVVVAYLSGKFSNGPADPRRMIV